MRGSSAFTSASAADDGRDARHLADETGAGVFVAETAPEYTARELREKIEDFIL